MSALTKPGPMSSCGNNNSAANSSSAATASSSGAGAAGSAAAGAGPPAHVQEFNIRVPKNLRKKHHVMRFNATLNVDFAKWRNVKLERENNMKEFRGMEEDMPKFGAGSEYNRDLREEVRRKKFGIIAKKYRPEAQPYILKVGGKSGKKFKGIREGGVSENAAFYVFTHAPDGAIEAYPLNEWYNFQPIQRYKALSAEEAEHEFGRRKKVMNYFSLMLRKRLKGDEEEEHDPEEVKVKGVSAAAKKPKELKISEMDEWIDSDDDSDTDEDDEEKKKKKEEDSDDDAGGKGKGGKKGKPKGDTNAEKKKKKRDVDDEAFEESDDGDEEGREMDYDTESSEDEPDPEAKNDKDMKSVAEEDALRKLLTSDEEDEDEKKSDESEKEEEEKKKREKQNKEENNKNKKKTKKQTKEEKKESSSDFSSDSSDSEDENSSNSKRKKPKDGAAKNSSNTANNARSRSGTPTTFGGADTNKRKLNSMPSDLTGSENSNSPASTPAKRPKTEMTAPSLPSTFAGVVNVSSKDDYGITEEAVRRYLMRKPMTATELLTKFKNKKTGVSSDRLVETMTAILKKINPFKQTIQGKMYLSIKVNK